MRSYLKQTKTRNNKTNVKNILLKYTLWVSFVLRNFRFLILLTNLLFNKFLRKKNCQQHLRQLL